MLLHDINQILDCYKSHNAPDIEFNDDMKAYSYGSTSNTYLLHKSSIIVKMYNTKLRWSTQNHDNIKDIFTRELVAMKQLEGVPQMPQLLSYDEDAHIIKSTYMGESLYNKFVLPHDWVEQIEALFDLLTQNNVNYPEFNLKNIVVLNDTVSFIDFGLAIFHKDCDNKDNKYIFIELLEMLDNKFKIITDTEQKQILYHTLLNNIKLECADKYSKNIF